MVHHSSLAAETSGTIIKIFRVFIYLEYLIIYMSDKIFVLHYFYQNNRMNFIDYHSQLIFLRIQDYWFLIIRLYNLNRKRGQSIHLK